MTRNLLLSAGFLMCATSARSQDWVDMMQQPGQNFYTVQASFEKYWQDRDISEKGKGYKQFKRWEHFMAPRVYPGGELWLPSRNLEIFEEFLATNATHKSSLSASSTWTAVGPMGAMTGSASNGFPRKAGRDNFITFHPTITTTYWAGAPSGGLWKTTNDGLTWSTTTDNLAVIGCSDLAIDPFNPSTMYLATGDGDASDTYCIGVLKSTDGGATWGPTGLSFTVNQMRIMRRLIIHPTNPLILLAATNAGIYRTTNGGTSWTQINSVNTFDLEFKPGNPNIVYAGGTAFYISTNGGLNFTVVSNGIATSGCNRMSVAVTPADTSYVYVLASSSANSGLLGVYRSVTGGTSFGAPFTSTNLLANACNGTGTGGQGWYDLTIAASPINKNEVVVGGVNAWRSQDGGLSWTNIGCWIGTGNPPYVHADHHEIEYNSAGIIYSANDGGVYSYTGSSWTDRTGARNIAQIYKIGLSATSPSLWITGHQDNGSNIYTGSTYKASMAGDGMDCFIDRTNNNNMFASYYNGQFMRSTNGGLGWSNATSGMAGSAAWVAPWKQDPVVSTRLYAGRTEIWISNNLGVSWTQLANMGGSGTIVEFAVAPSNNQVIYAIKGTSIRKTVNGGSTWTLINGTVPVGSAAPTFITVDPSDPNTAWVTLSGYSNGNKVFRTTDGGATWTNISANLPNLPANCSVYQPGSNDRIYIGMDVGVYYKDNSSSTWTLYNTGLPNVPIADLEISPAANTLLRAATYGRGVYQVDLIQSQFSPTSSFSFNGPFCAGVPKTFSDNSTESPTSWSWSVAPASGATLSSATVQNPQITFAPGTYTVSMAASNQFGNGNVASQAVTVNPVPAVTIAAGSGTSCVNDPVTLQGSGADTYTWTPGNSNASSVSFTAATSVTYTLKGAASGCTNQATYQLFVSPCTLISEQGSLAGFSIFPNPVSSEMHLRQTDNSIREVFVEIYDMTGRLVHHASLAFSGEANEQKLNHSALPAGTYQLNVKAPDYGIQKVRFVKE